MVSDAILVTGGAGYIGSHVVLALQDAGRRVVVADNFVTGRREAIPAGVDLAEIDVGDRQSLDALFKKYKFSAVMHFAGSVVVPESVSNPLKYYSNNTQNSLILLDACVRHGVTNFVFSSTAAVYGDLAEGAVHEGTPMRPISPYGMSKLMTEFMIEDVQRAIPWFNAVRLRYFNVAGADPAGRTGQGGPESTHLIRVALDVALGRREILDVFGEDYDTRDGTCERDYIHVSDLAAAHISAITYLEAGGKGDVFNCGYGRGVTVSEVVAAIEETTGKPLPLRFVSRRPGDPGSLISNPAKLLATLDWTPKHADLKQIIENALAWQSKQVRGANLV